MKRFKESLISWLGYYYLNFQNQGVQYENATKNEISQKIDLLLEEKDNKIKEAIQCCERLIDFEDYHDKKSIRKSLIEIIDLLK